MDPKELAIRDFTYNLPAERIAYRPLNQRHDAKLLVYTDGNIAGDIYKNLSKHLPDSALVVFNNTKVVEARLLFEKSTGGIIEIFCLEPHEMYNDISSAMACVTSVKWLCLLGGASKWKPGLMLKQQFYVNKKSFSLTANNIEKRADCFVVELNWEGDFTFAEVLHHAGHVPLPPYIKRADDEIDKTRYQTVFARYDGSVAAPTAGLHFTDHIFQELEKKNIQRAFVTLHVGAGTFKPVKVAEMRDHDMHSEFIEVELSMIENLLQLLNVSLIAVGTTSLRTIESLYWLGYKLCNNADSFSNEMPFVAQWDPYESKKEIDVTVALRALINYMNQHNLVKLIAKTQIIIVPGYQFKLVKGLITNFHQPSSTLLLLVAAFIGEDWEKVYKFALSNNFRFLSYGDGSLLWRKINT